jgi:hypothetical protein
MMLTIFYTCWNHHKKGTKIERRKTEGISQLRLSYIFTWKCHSETPYRATLNKMPFFSPKKPENTKAKQVLSRGWYQWEGGGQNESV